MAKPVRYTLLADGPSDRMLLPILEWSLSRCVSLEDCSLVPQFAEPATLQTQTPGLAGKVAAALRQYPCDLLFVHRDAERETREKRVAEIREAVGETLELPHVCVVPVRMSEAWLLLDAAAIRRAADNPNSRVSLSLPPLRQLDRLPDPKALLRNLLVEASEMSGRRREHFRRDLSWRCQLVATFIADYSPLLALPAFAAFHEETQEVVQHLQEEE